MFLRRFFLPFTLFFSLKVCTHRPIFTGSSEESAVESANSTAEWADSTTDSVIVGRLALSNMFNILSPLESTDGNRPIIGVGRRGIDQVDTILRSTEEAVRGAYYGPGLQLPTEREA